jgi:hypothetical protein
VSGEKVNRRNLWAAWAVVVGAAFAVVAVTNAAAILYVVIAVIAGAGYMVITQLTRDQDRARRR